MNVRFMLLFLLFVNAVQAKPAIEEHFEFYDIYPVSKEDIRSEIQQRTPIISQGSRFDGRTLWQVAWQYYRKKSDNLCHITRNEITLKVLYTMPAIAPKFTVKPKVRDAFDSYYQALLNHEKGHKKIGIQAASAIEQALLNFKSFSHCQGLDTAVNKAITAIINNHHRQDEDYDRQTEHGKLQGVSIDNPL
ncbi:DUF922 domain-containing Zn-dependent protease [Thalassomonas actiniarum]|uniref:DUF922 domain-containing protein n=1 Tax=Thalassomonas actiniarum TaxID=485447 RepID=A0AAE9YVF7_9GAMM|nr:DUF922 domain-containing protein [Thalassomonas actiniarum]WDE01070.1 DUF922 domain-containing protein [Thalassomonas actiniarum]